MLLIKSLFKTLRHDPFLELTPSWSSFLELNEYLRGWCGYLLLMVQSQLSHEFYIHPFAIVLRSW
jgi:hypothetical protein